MGVNTIGQRIIANGFLDFGPVTYSHDDLTPALIPLEDVPFNQLDWPIPSIKTGNIMVGISSRPIDDADFAFYQTDWPNPILAKKIALTWLNDNQNNVLGPITAPPFNQLEWKTFDRKPTLLISALAKQTEDANIAFNQLDWENPSPSRKPALTWLNNNQTNTLAPIEATPFTPIDTSNPKTDEKQNLGFIFNRKLDEPINNPFSPIEFKNPGLKGQQNNGSTISRPQYYTDLSPNNQYNWPIPAPKKLKSETWIQNLLENTLAPIGVQSPFNNADFNLIRKRSYILTDISSAVNISPSIQPPNEIEYPNPLRKRIPTLTWLQDRKFFYQDIKPFKQDNYPNPLLKKGSPNTWIFVRKQDEPAIEYMPCSVLDWPNPAPKRKIALSWTSQIAQLQQIFTSPIGLPFFQIPVLKTRPLALTWLQTRPFYYSEPLINPFKNVDWKIPEVRKVTLLINYLQKFNISVIGNPFNQKDWPNPARKKRLPEQWEFYYQQDDNQPPVAQFLTIPVLRRKSQNLGWIFRSQIGEVITNPNRTFDYPNPIILKRQNNGLVINLLQSTLNPGEGEKPFNQNDYPNPVRAKKILHSGWIQDKKTYYTEEPLQPAQYDWPVFRAIKRNHVGFISFKIGTSEPPKFVSTTEVPIRRRGVAESWLYSSLIDLNFVPGLKPFSQNDWPIIRGKGQQNRGIIIQGGYIIPNIVGRIICLSADVTLYDLEAALTEFDLEAMETDYDLESGGQDCE